MRSKSWSAARGWAAGVAALGMVLAGCAETKTSETSGNSAPNNGAPAPGAAPAGAPGDIASLCGTRPIKIAFAKGKGDSWTKITLAELKKEAAKCPNIKATLYTDAGGDQTKSLSDINSLVAQDVDIIVVMAEFGAAQLSAMRSAVKSGTKVIALIDDPGGKAGTDYTDMVLPDTEATGRAWAEWIGKVAPSGKAVFLGGVPGAQSSQQFFKPVQAALAAYPNVKLVENRVVDTDWEPGKRKQVMSGLLAKYGRIDVVISDYGAIDNATLDAYKQAGMAPPALAAVASSNGTACYWKSTPFPYMSIDGQVKLAAVALRKGLAALNNITDTEPSVVPMPVEVDTAANKNPVCSPNLPPDASLGSSLTPAELDSIFK
ncbi:substrate-binding domain-containing protein [Embleya hyalina]|uniref:Sugar ABC transporter substrate-binding protein n=1 Tax=Embleya hyalina TaxID=516124 RepID=A0A401YQX6_9ACTN|nr:substrate-binding domain-containing protein [Embleya hyalina]GCD96993.1 sugar ABC transporter substrate-binding protein [Embleya hyalina]